MRAVTKNLLKTTLFLTTLGLILTSKDVLMTAIIPLFFLLIPYGIKVTSVETSYSKPEHVGVVFDVEIRLVCVGFGIAKVMHKLPNDFELVDGANAVTSFVFGKRTVVVKYKAKPLKRGVYRLNELILEKEHPLLISKSLEKLNVDIEFEVKQRLRRVVKVETVRTKAKSPIPDIDISKIGTPGTDFKEIKEYVQGDPVKFINWKATAKTGKLMVNRYEVEGKKAIWIFLDANSYMGYCLEYAIELASALVYHFCSRGHKVGIYVVGSGIYVYPDVGKRQFRRIFEELVRVESGKEDLASALHKVKKTLLIYKPFVFLITRVEYSKPYSFISELLKIGLKCQVITLKGDLECDEFAKVVFELLRLRAKRKVMALDVDVNKPVYSVVARFVK